MKSEIFYRSHNILRTPGVRFVYNTVMPNECVNYMRSNDKQRDKKNEFVILFQDKWNVSSRGRKLILEASLATVKMLYPQRLFNYLQFRQFLDLECHR